MAVKHVAGIVVLAIAIGIFIYLSYILPSQDTIVYDDKVTWFHMHVVRYLEEGKGFSDQHLWFPHSFDLLRAPVLMDQLAIVLGLTEKLGLLTITMGILLAVLVYVMGLTVFREPIAAGIGVLLSILAPATLYWFRVNMYGAYIGVAIGFLSLLVIGYGFRKNSLPLGVVGVGIASLSWILWSAGWVVLLVFSLYMLVLIYSGRISRNILVMGLLLSIITIPLNIVGVSKFITVYHIFAYSLLLASLVSGYIEFRIIAGFREPIKRNIWRFLGIFIPIALAVSITYIIGNAVELPGVPETYLKEYRPLPDYMAIAVLAPFSLVLFLRGGFFSDIEKKFIEFIGVAGFIVGMIAAEVDPTLTVFTIATISPIIAYSLERVSVASIRGIKSRWKYLYLAATIWIIVSAVAANAFASYTTSTSKPAIYYGLIPRNLVETPPKESAILSVLQHINTSSSLVVASWGKAYWIVGYSNQLYVIADDNAPEYNKRLLSQILVGNEYLAVGIAKKLVEEHSITSVYILVSEVISVEKPIAGTSNSAHIGRPLVVTTREGLKQALFVPVDDTANFITYLHLANYTVSKYIDSTKAQYPFQLPLSWSENAKDTVLVKLLVTAIEKLGYTPINDVYSKAAIVLLEQQKPKYIKLVNATTVYLYSVGTDISNYDVYYMAALFKIDLEAFSSK